MNLLRAGRTQARARFASGPARGAARPARARGRGGVRCQKAQLRALPESEGVPGSAQEVSVSAVSRARGAHCLGGPAWMRGSISASAEPRGGWGARQVCSGHRAPGLEEPLVGKPRAGALAAESWPARPRGSPSLSSGVGRCSKSARGHPRSPSPPFCSGSHLPLIRRRVLPIHRTDPAVKAPSCSSACLCREAAKSPGDREGALRKTGGAQPACYYSPGSTVREGCKKSSGRTLR